MAGIEVLPGESMDDSKVNILLVDDRPEKLLALQALLEDLQQNIVLAHSGQEALRYVLTQDFAVILLDVNMPGMDGFETAQFIRQRRNSAHVPIIFLTAMSDEMHIARGYSLGAVDYILTPVVPEVLRSKVAVFVDLFRKTQQVQSQAERLRHRAMQLHRLTCASLAINSAPSVDKIVQVTTETARAIVGTNQAVMIVAPSQRPTHVAGHASYSQKYAKWEHVIPRLGDHHVHSMVRESKRPMRMTLAELQAQGDLLDTHSQNAPPLRGLLAIPLMGRDGCNMGLVFLSDKIDGEFTEDDQAVLVQLAQMACVAIENTMFAEERESNRVKDEFLSTLSHELRTPLSAISGWIRLLKMEKVEGKVARGLSVIERNVDAQIKLIEELLDLSRVETGKLSLNTRSIALRTVVEAAVDALRPAIAEKGITLDCQLNGQDANITGDPNRLQQVFGNLLSNAMKFTPAGGQINVRLTRTDGGWQVAVTDTGEGIDPAFLPHVFDRFRQADSTSSRRHGGLGIGLTIVRHIVALHGGSVSADSQGKGLGSTFSVKIPFGPAPQEPGDSPKNNMPSRSNADVPPPSLDQIRILLVDDEPYTREVVTGMLERCGADVTAAGSAREAINLFAVVRPDVVVSDLAMPDMDGFALLRELRMLSQANGGSTPAIALTAYVRAEDQAQALAAGFQVHIAKPVDPARLATAVLDCARDSRHNSQRKEGHMPTEGTVEVSE
ncbi:MAG TPA: response regulator [Tepidisphaeraceae bacterium]|nr:response regulator [Tepidisphaeraceae bacterium]